MQTPSKPAASELELLRAAHSVLTTSPMTALARLNEHRADYPHGLLREEREVLTIEALLAAERPRQARSAAAAFNAAFPHSVHAARIERLFASRKNIAATHGNAEAVEALIHQPPE